METQKLYYQDPYLREFPATVLSCEAAGEVWKVVLDQTAFYPEGGGQPADHGVLKAASREIPVTDVHEKDGRVLHTCAAPVEAEYEDVAFTGIRKVIAKSMTTSLQSMAQLTQHFSFNAAAIQSYRKLVKGIEALGLPWAISCCTPCPAPCRTIPT